MAVDVNILPVTKLHVKKKQVGETNNKFFI